MVLVRKMEASEVTPDGHRPLEPIIIAHCGELELVIPPRLKRHLAAAEERDRRKVGRAEGKKSARALHS